MPLTGQLGTLSSTLGNIVLAFGGPALGFTRHTFLEVAINGTVLTNVLSAHVSLGFDLAVAEATVILAAEPSTSSYNDTVTIAMGAGSNNVNRFTGLLKQYDRGLYPRMVTLTCRGPLSRAAEYKPFGQPDAQAYQIAGVAGLTLTELMGSTTATDQNVVFAALQRAGVTDGDGSDVNQGLIGGTGTDLGSLPPDATIWGVDTTALDFIHNIDSASLGYRVFESIGGTIYRAQIRGWPGNNVQDFAFTESHDIFSGRSTRTILELKNCARVDGYNYGVGAGIITFILPGSNGIQGSSADNPQEVRFSTNLAGRINAADTGPGFSCEDIATYLLDEWNRELVRLTLTTPRDDVIGPGQTHLITTDSNLPDRLGIAEKAWVQRVDIEVNEAGEFSQTIQYIGGGLGGSVDGYPSPIDWSTQ